MLFQPNLFRFYISEIAHVKFITLICRYVQDIEEIQLVIKPRRGLYGQEKRQTGRLESLCARQMLLICGGRALHLGETRRGIVRRGARDVREAGGPVLPAGEGALQLEGRGGQGVRRAERPRAARGEG